MHRDYARVTAALQYLDAHAGEQPPLADVAAHVGLSPHHFQRTFRRWVGISPKRFLQLVTIQHAKAALAASASVLDATYDAGLSSPGRLHDLFVALDAVTPGEFKARGRGLTIRAGVHDSPFGYCLLAVTERGICGLSFHDDRRCEEGLEDLSARWPAARIEVDPAATGPVMERVLGHVSDPARFPLTLRVRGTNFQVQVWQALLRLGPGQLATYGDVARRIGRPRAVRAVGGAVGRNPVAWLIPCHRVITSTGTLGHYRWGAERKRAMVGWEAAREELRQTAS
jgi:AraC family transcriptional regulator of adaptative response/methylated-DNA-[protein]-cysteine methyltransferase